MMMSCRLRDENMSASCELVPSAADTEERDYFRRLDKPAFIFTLYAQCALKDDTQTCRGAIARLLTLSDTDVASTAVCRVIIMFRAAHGALATMRRRSFHAREEQKRAESAATPRPPSSITQWPANVTVTVAPG